jgi:transcriptional regulator with XRE-family HTH domain
MSEPTQGGARRCVNCGAGLASDNTARMCAKCHREQIDQLSHPPHLKNEFFETDDFRRAFEKQHIGLVLKVYRHHPRHLRLFGKALNQGLLGRWLGLTQAQVSKLENGKPEQNLETLRHYAKVLHLPQYMLWFDFPGQSRLNRPVLTLGSENSPVEPHEQLRVGLTDAFAAALLNDASVDDLEQQALQIGKATRFRSPESLVLDLQSGLVEVKRIIAHSRSEIVSRQSARVAAQMSGLMSLSLLKLDDRIGARNWVRTARLLAAQTNDRKLRSWVQAQAAYFHFYDKDLPGTIEAAQYSQDLESGNPGVGSALAAAVEARAYAIMDQSEDAMRAMSNVETYLDRLPGEANVPSAFGYNEAQFRFHQESALTRLGEVAKALQVQERALLIIPPEDFMDRALVLLDRADCLTMGGEISSAIELATTTLSGLDSAQAQGIIANRAHETLLALPPEETRRPEALELRDAIISLS